VNDEVVNRLEFFLALAGLAVLGFGYWLAQQGRDKEHRRERNQALVVLGVLGALAYPNFGWLHFGNFIHTWDTYHYYIGAKYFPELAYDRLYDCTAIADDESGLHARVARRAITDLRTNVMVSTNEILAQPEACKSHFSPERWDAFKKDISWFRGRLNAQKWDETQRDHGYNATPVWTIAGHALTQLAPASLTQVTLLNLLDPLLLLGMAYLIYWAFGWKVLAVAMLVYGTNFPSRYYWTGGAYLRHDWIFFSVAFVCLLKKERPLLAGLAIAYATTLRLFPGLMMVGPILAALEILRTERRIDRRYLRLFVGAGLGVLALLSTSLITTGGLETYQRFAQNTAKHAGTPLTNHMGLRTALSYRPSQIGAVLRDGRARDPWAVWKEARLNSFHEARPLYIAGILGFLALLFFAARGAKFEPWVVAALSTVMIPVSVELTCYYYCFIIALALLVEKRREVALLLLGLTAITQFIQWAPLSNMSSWDDEKYVAMSFATLIAFGLVQWLFTKDGERYCLAPEPPLEPAPSEAAGRDKKKRR
jgi:hypothetical protein